MNVSLVGWSVTRLLVLIECFDVSLSVQKTLSRFGVIYPLSWEDPFVRSTRYGVSQTTINHTLSALSSLYKYLTEEVENEDGEPYFYRNVMKKVQTKKNPKLLASRAENIRETF